MYQGLQKRQYKLRGTMFPKWDDRSRAERSLCKLKLNIFTFFLQHKTYNTRNQYWFFLCQQRIFFKYSLKTYFPLRLHFYTHNLLIGITVLYNTIVIRIVINFFVTHDTSRVIYLVVKLLLLYFSYVYETWTFSSFK